MGDRQIDEIIPRSRGRGDTYEGTTTTTGRRGNDILLFDLPEERLLRRSRNQRDWEGMINGGGSRAHIRVHIATIKSCRRFRVGRREGCSAGTGLMDDVCVIEDGKSTRNKCGDTQTWVKYLF